jgi:hypothetical protein
LSFLESLLRLRVYCCGRGLWSVRESGVDWNLARRIACRVTIRSMLFCVLVFVSTGEEEEVPYLVRLSSCDYVIDTSDASGATLAVTSIPFSNGCIFGSRCARAI